MKTSKLQFTRLWIGLLMLGLWMLSPSTVEASQKRFKLYAPRHSHHVRMLFRPFAHRFYPPHYGHAITFFAARRPVFVRHPRRYIHYGMHRMGGIRRTGGRGY